MRPNLRRPDPDSGALMDPRDDTHNRLIFKHYFLISLFFVWLLQIGTANSYMLETELGDIRHFMTSPSEKWRSSASVDLCILRISK
jgi:hypothetical protein